MAGKSRMFSLGMAMLGAIGSLRIRARLGICSLFEVVLYCRAAVEEQQNARAEGVFLCEFSQRE